MCVAHAWRVSNFILLLGVCSKFQVNSRYFLEEDAVNSEGKLVVEKQKSVNKIGHGQFFFSFLLLQISLTVQVGWFLIQNEILFFSLEQLFMN
jgi:hypothetical protein